MADSAAPTPEASTSRFIIFRDAFISGLILILPLFVTVWLCVNIIDWVGRPFRVLLPDSIRDQAIVGNLFEIFITAVVILAITAIGFLSRDVFGKFMVTTAERLMLTIPGLSAVYATVKQIVDTFGSKHELFRQVVMVQFPRQGMWAIGFLTNKTRGEAQAKTGEEVWTVFIPTSPNPTGGYILLVPPRDIIVLEMSVGEGMKMIVSGGAVIPPWQQVKAMEAAN
jgi:uncharacterized membrane protein